LGYFILSVHRHVTKKRLAKHELQLCEQGVIQHNGSREEKTSEKTA
jgi:hypothetical protein